MEESARETVEPHLAAGESPLAVHEGAEDVVVVTDRRVIRASEDERSSDIESVVLRNHHVLGARIRDREAGNPDTGQATLGAVFAIAGAALAYLSLTGGFLGRLGSDAGSIILLAAVVAVPSGAYLVYEALQTADAHIEVNVVSTGGETQLELPTEATGVAEAISEVVGNSSG